MSKRFTIGIKTHHKYTANRYGKLRPNRTSTNVTFLATKYQRSQMHSINEIYLESIARPLVESLPCDRGARLPPKIQSSFHL